MTFEPGELGEICSNMLGQHAVDRLSEILGVNTRTIQRWISGAQDVPTEVEKRIRDQQQLLQKIGVATALYRQFQDFEAQGLWSEVVLSGARSATLVYQMDSRRPKAGPGDK